ncbi:MAG: hypothetical protein IT449_11655 [Phycisphaerales bacterium]|nr:hypothetical protein [Phycisphaerales bacterium]
MTDSIARDQQQGAPSSNGGISPIVLPVSRVRAAMRFAFYALAAGGCYLLLRLAAPAIRFTPSGASNRIEDYALLAALLPVAGLGLWLAWRGTRWLALAGWPGRVGIEAGERELVLALGPFGSLRLDAARLRAVYLFELDEDDLESDQFEAHLPENHQRQTLLPRMTHPECPFPLRERLLLLLGGDEADLARQLAPVIHAWRGEPWDADTAGRRG